jgi:hypothetical protein
MKITNKLNLPQAIVEVAMKNNEDYVFNPNSFGVTTLLKPIREIILSRKYRDNIEQDVSEMINLLFGSAFHKMFEELQEKDVLKEQKVSYEVLDNMFLSGIYDRYNTKTFTIEDYKTSSVNKNDFSDYKMQGLMYAYLLRKNGLYVENIKFYVFYKDYKQYMKDKLPIEVLEWQVHSSELQDIERIIKEKFKALKDNHNVDDDKLPMCSDKERWYSGEKYAIMKHGSSKAIKVFDNEQEAKDYGIGDYIEKRSGINLKCEKYCSARKFCPFGKEIIKEI